MFYLSGIPVRHIDKLLLINIVIGKIPPAHYKFTDKYYGKNTERRFALTAIVVDRPAKIGKEEKYQ